MLRLQITKQYHELLFKRQIAHRGVPRRVTKTGLVGKVKGLSSLSVPPSPPPFHLQNTHSSFFLYDLWREREFKCQHNCGMTS